MTFLRVSAAVFVMVFACGVSPQTAPLNQAQEVSRRPTVLQIAIPNLEAVTISYVEPVVRNGYSIEVPSVTEAWWRETFLFSSSLGGLDSYSVRVGRYQTAFVAAILQPELTTRLKQLRTSASGVQIVSDFAAQLSGRSGLSSQALNLASILKSNRGIFELQPKEIQTTLLNFQQLSENKYIADSLGQLSTRLGGLSLASQIVADVAQEIFYHMIANAKARERLDSLEAFVTSRDFNSGSSFDPALREGFDLAKSDILEFIQQDFLYIRSTINSLQTHGFYLIEASEFAPTIAQQFRLTKNFSGTISRVVLPYYLGYEIGASILGDLSDMQAMCAAARLNSVLLERVRRLQVLPKATDPSFCEAQRLLLTTAQVRYGLGYWYNSKYDEVLTINLATSVADWLKLLGRVLARDFTTTEAFRSEVLYRGMEKNLAWALAAHNFLGATPCYAVSGPSVPVPPGSLTSVVQ